MQHNKISKLIESTGAQFIDVRFCDLFGREQHFTIPTTMWSEDLFDEGLGFDGSSVSGFQGIQDSDLVLKPDEDSAYLDPFTEHPTLNVIFQVFNPHTNEIYIKDTRELSKRAEEYLRSTGIADTAFVGPEAEFFIFDSVQYESSPNKSFYEVDSVEGAWNTGNKHNIDGSLNLGNKPGYKGGYYPTPPHDHFQDLRSEMVNIMQDAGLEVEVQHHEVGTAGQAEIDLKFDKLSLMADRIIRYKYIVKNTARQYGYSATFMPKPIYGDNGSGMHIHISLWKDGETLFYSEDGYANLSELAIHFIGGVLHHAPSLLAFTNPGTNSYKRLVPGYEAPVNLVYSSGNRSAAIRIPAYVNSPKAKRIEFRCPDPSANPYLAFSALLMAGIDGIKKKIQPPAPVSMDLYEASEEELAEIKQVPASLEEALSALETDNEYLLEGGVFSKELIEEYISFKRINECDEIRLRPHPHEFSLYY
jgi:glutamine synthetase